MLTVLPPFFDHRRHKLVVHRLPIALDVPAFEGEERLSQPFLYRVEFTSVEQDIGAERMVGQDAQFSLDAAAHTLPNPLPDHHPEGRGVPRRNRQGRQNYPGSHVIARNRGDRDPQ